MSRIGAARVEREQGLRQRCEVSSVSGVEHMKFDCAGLAIARLKQSSTFALERIFSVLFQHDPIKLAAFVNDCDKACGRSVRYES